jgi:hypothetical protein
MMQRNESVFSEATLALGKIHWSLLRAANLMDSLRLKRIEKYKGIYTTEWTEFGHEVGADEIHWWVFKKDPRLPELREQTQGALESAQSLKNEAGKLEDAHPQTYDELLLLLRAFAEKQKKEIQSIYKYVAWLEARDRLAPIILFTYRVWGSTRMSDRWLAVPLNAPSVPDKNNLELCVEIVLGLRDRISSTYEYIEAELSYEIWESMDPEQIDESAEITVPVKRVLARASKKIFKECSIYFAEIRDSLRNILIDIDKFEEQKNVMHSDAFWREFVARAVQTKKTETQLWDFKETLTMWHVREQSERDRAKVVFAEDVASFANSSGGVLVIGVTDQREIVGLGNSARDIENRLKNAKEVLARHLEYQGDVVVFHPVPMEVKNETKICLVIVVGQTHSVMGVNDGNGRFTYPVRLETGIERMSSLEISGHKLHIKSDNYDFIGELRQFTREI